MNYYGCLKQGFIGVAFSCLTYSPLFANNDVPQYVLGLDLGLSETTSLGNAITFPLGYSTFIYTPYHHTDTPLRYGVSLSKNIPLTPFNTLQLGVSYHPYTSMQVNGTLQQGISQPYYEASYSYSIQGAQLLAEAKLEHLWRNRYAPYLIAGIGAGFNKAQQYATTVPNYLTLTPFYTNNTTTSFSYTAGLGVDLFIKPELSIGLGYRFSDLGSVGLGQGAIRNTPVSNVLNQSHLYLNTVLIQLNCFFK
ncbi:MAG: hypothetical protein NTW08_06890 [Gammaproteobacteria bacterium]|nr:hypothetical protein [Gammaproteobacteria bacterium]